MSDEITNTSYWEQISSIATELVTEAMDQSDNDQEAAEELINDTLLSETIDGHQWVIYYHYNLPVLQFSSNESYMEDNMGADGVMAALYKGGISGLHTAMAFWAMYADVQANLENAFSS